MWLDAALAYLHYTAIFMLFAFLTVAGDAAPRDRSTSASCGCWARVGPLVRRPRRARRSSPGSCARACGAKGGDFYFNAWPIYVKIALFVAVGLHLDQAHARLHPLARARSTATRAGACPPTSTRAMRRIVMIEVHLAALIPIFAVIMARGLGR